MAEEIKIIEYQEKYKNEIIEFLIEVAIGEFGFHEWEKYFKEKSFAPYENNEGKFLIALDKDNKIIGTCGALKQSEDCIKLNSFYISSEYRKSGIGKKLYNLIYDYIVENEYKEIILCTYEKFDIEVKFYEKRGFKKYKIEHEDEMWYRKELYSENTTVLI